MPLNFIYPEFEVVRQPDRCIRCRVCERQCANEVHSYNEEKDIMVADETKCVNCHRCVTLCPTRALKIVKTDHTFRPNANWTGDTIQQVYRQAVVCCSLLWATRSRIRCIGIRCWSMRRR